MIDRETDNVSSMLIVIAAIALILFLSFLLPEIIEERPSVAVTIVDIEKVQVVIPSLFGVTTHEFLLAEMETNKGEFITGIVDVISLKEGDKIFVMEKRRYLKKVYHGYEWYKFSGRQQEDEMTQKNLSF